MARAIQKLVRNGSSTQVTIPRMMLIPLGWLPGMEVVIEMLEDNTIRVRPLEDAAFKPKAIPRIVYDAPAPVGR